MADIAKILDAIRNRRPYRLRVVLLCTMAATTFWFLNALNKEHTTTLNYPLEFLYDSQTYLQVDELPANVLINVNGNGWNLLKNSLGFKVSPLQIPLANPQEQKAIAASVLPGLISEQLSDFQLNYVLTDTLRVHLDQRFRKYVVMRVDSSEINLAPLRQVDSEINFIPDSITIEGPRILVNGIPDTLLLSLGENLIEEDFNETVRIPIQDERVSLSSSEVRVNFNVVSLVERSLRIDLTQVGFQDSTAQIFPDEILIYFTATEASADNYVSDDFEIVVDFNEIREDSTLRPEILRIPDGIRTVRADSIRIQLLRE